MKTYVFIMFSLLACLYNSPSDLILGEYWTEGRMGKVAVYKCDNKYCGRITWRKDNRKDIKNPVESKRNRNVVGIQFLSDFNYDKHENKWIGGSVYSIDNGKTYRGKIWLDDNGGILKMRGYIGISLLGRTATFRRVWTE